MDGDGVVGLFELERERCEIDFMHPGRRDRRWASGGKCGMQGSKVALLESSNAGERRSDSFVSHSFYAPPLLLRDKTLP